MDTNFSAVVFDFDGVLVDSEPLHYRAMAAAARRIGVEFGYDEYRERYLGLDDRDAFRKMLRKLLPGGGTGDPDPEAVSRLCAGKADHFERLIEAGVPVLPGARELIGEIHGRLPLAIASGALRREIDRILAGAGLAGYFEEIVAADQVQRSKPDPQTYQLAVAGLARRPSARGLLPDHCLAIEDSPAGLAAARAAGLRTMGVATTTEAGVLELAERVVPSLEGVTLDLLRRWFCHRRHDNTPSVRMCE